MPRHTDRVPVGGPAAATWPDQRDPSMVTATHWGKPGRRRRALLAVAATFVLVLALAASGVGGVLYALHSLTPTTTYGPATEAPTAIPTTGPGASPTVRAKNTPTVARNPTMTPVLSPTATPLLTPTMIVSASPLNFQPYTYPSGTKYCRAEQTLTNISAVDAHWSWSNSISPTGWNYSLSEFQDKLNNPWPGTLSITTSANNGRAFVFIQAPYDTNCTGKTPATHPPFVVTISVTDGTGTQFNVTY